MNKQPVYQARHPVALALAALAAAARRGSDLLDSLAEQARGVGVRPFSDEFDEAARLVGYHYSRAWDAYLDRATWAEAEGLPA